jgi:hypothetical protein
MIEFTHDVQDLVDSQWNIDPTKFKPNMVINGASEHYGNGMLEILASMLDNDSIVYSHNPDDHLRLPNLKFYPYWYHWMVEEFPDKHYKKHMSTDHCQYLMGCFNMSSHPHRILNWLHIRKLKNCVITMHNDEKFNGNNVITLTPEEKNKWDQLKVNLSTPWLTSIHGPQEANTDCYFNQVTETTICDRVFLTEKTWKPIATGQLFVLLSNPGSIEHLRSVGIDCFDDIIDHGYDLEPDPRKRIYQVWQSMDKLFREDLYQINKSTRDRRQKNLDLFWSGKLYGV